MDLAHHLVDFGVGLKFQDLPQEVVEMAKKLILDNLGVVVNGSRAPGTEGLVNMVLGWGGKPESSLVVFGGKVPAPYAALVNCSMARAHDYDDFHDRAMLHTTGNIVPACLAMAEQVGGINGKDFITAVVLGIDVMIRLGLSLRRNFLTTGMNVTPHFGAFGSSLAAGKILNLSPKEMIYALGIAYSMVSGNVLSSREGTMMTHIQIGLSSQAGILSATMAQNGINGPQGVFQGDFGYFAVYQRGEYDPSVITENLGKKFEINGVSIKYFPCCLCSHAAILAILQLRQEERIDPEEVHEIRVAVTQGNFNVVCHPLDKKRNASSFKEALFSLPYGVASALVRGRLSLEDFTPEAIQDEKVRRLANKVTPYADKAITEQYGRTLGPEEVEVILKNGERRSRRVDFVKGHPQNPMSMEEVEEKFKKCLRSSARPLKDEQASALIKAVKELDTLTDVSQIVRWLK